MFLYKIQVEDIMKMEPAAADLAKSGQRMLWCHTPQVIHSGLLRKLKKLYFNYRDFSNSKSLQ